jgi:antitoxin component YwqK of YwqJK toxin-antitoxin module
MLNPKSILICTFLLVSDFSFAQSDTINQKDTSGFRQGYWIIYGAYFPERAYCDTCRIEEGRYLSDKKTGEWKMYRPDGTLKTVGTFENGRPGGDYIKFSPIGNRIETGTFKNGKQAGELRVYYESGCLASQRYFDVEGKQSGEAVYYNDDCRLDSALTGTVAAKTAEPQMKYFHYGYVTEATSANSSDLKRDSVDPDGRRLWVEEGKSFDPDGMNKLYDINGYLVIEGQFKEGKLWNGKIYAYDEDGIMTRIEIWKNGSR